MKTKIMATSDWAACGTGFSEELRHILYRLAQTGEYEIYWIGFNYVGYSIDLEDKVFADLPHKGATVKCLSGVGPPEEYGLQGLIRNFGKYYPDFVMSMGDPKNFQPYIKHRHRTNLRYPYICYTTLDGTPIHPAFKEVFKHVNVPLAMTQWALEEYQKADIHMSGYIHHGVNWQWMATNKSEKMRIRRRYGIDDDTVLFMEANVNQFRKRQDALLSAWRDFRPEIKNAKLYLYTDSDMSRSLGWHLETLIEQLGVPRNTILLPEDVYGQRKWWEQATDLEFHRQQLAMADVFCSCTSGEGFGKLFLEGLSLQKPVVVPNYSAMPEVCERGAILVPLYEGPAGYYRMQDKLRLSPGGVVNQAKFTEALQYLYDHPEEREELGAQGREWAKNFDYDTQVIPGWTDILNRLNPDVILSQEMLRDVM